MSSTLSSEVSFDCYSMPAMRERLRELKAKMQNGGTRTEYAELRRQFVAIGEMYMRRCT